MTAQATDIHPRIVGVGTANPPRTYTQPELLQLFGLKHPINRRVFKASHIHKRHLVLPDPNPETGLMDAETPVQLHAKFREWALNIGRDAINKALEDAQIGVQDIDAIFCVTSSGFMVPGLSALYIREMGMKTSLQRVDVVGMGCNAGLNGLLTLWGWSRANPGKNALLVCCEVNSAIYSFDDSPRDGIVNSLFGDGAAAVVVKAAPDGEVAGPRVLTFESHIIPEQWDAMRFDWHAERNLWHFYLSKEIPYILGVHCNTPLNRLLKSHDLRRQDVEHWVIHTGGGSVIDSIKLKLGLSEHDVRHTRSVLRDFGNLSSGSFLFSYQRLIEEKIARPGDYGVMMTMGPGAQIETALLQW